MSLTLPLRQAAVTAPSMAGGKARRLGRMLDAGLPVPDGFVVTAPLGSGIVTGSASVRSPWRGPDLETSFPIK